MFSRGPSSFPRGYSRSASATMTSLAAGASGVGKVTEVGLSCEYCGKICPRPSILKRHMMMHTGERPFECKVTCSAIPLPPSFQPPAVSRVSENRQRQPH